eukprot:4186604-Prymnesium_polylepis.1
MQGGACVLPRVALIAAAAPGGRPSIRNEAQRAHACAKHVVVEPHSRDDFASIEWGVRKAYGAIVRESEDIS